MDLMPYWRGVRAEVAGLPEQVPEAWAFGAEPAQADELLALVLAGIKSATASSLWDYEAEGEPLPTAGGLSIILDGRGEPRAVILTTDVHVVAFRGVDAEHAHAEGEGDRSLAHWRAVHEQFWRQHSPGGRGFDDHRCDALRSARQRFPRQARVRRLCPHGPAGIAPSPQPPRGASSGALDPLALVRPHPST